MKQNIFQAIADPARRAILTLIAVQALIPNAMAENLDMSRQAVSKHIRVLQECELIKPEQSGGKYIIILIPKKCKKLIIGWPNSGKSGKPGSINLTKYYQQLKK